MVIKSEFAVIQPFVLMPFTISVNYAALVGYNMHVSAFRKGINSFQVKIEANVSNPLK